MYDVIIIGAGMSGLAAGIRLAHYERRVCILERHTTIGGLNSFYRLGGRNYDVGLHAVTNFTPKGARRGPLARVLKQLRFSWDDFDLVPQTQSAIAFPDVRLAFSNDPALLEEQIQQRFPAEVEGFQRMAAEMPEYEQLGSKAGQTSAREVVGRYIHDPLLVEMLFCPLMYYGNAREHDMDFGQFCIMFRSIFLEGMSRPLAGVRLILKKLVRRFRELGGELRLRSGVKEIQVEDGIARRVVLDNGAVLEGKQILSSAGKVETQRLLGAPEAEISRSAGQLSFVEAVAILDRQPRDLGHDETIVFFNDSSKFHWEKPAELTDVRSGVICSPNNFAYDQPPPEGVMRITALANFDRWTHLAEEEYRQQKQHWFGQMMASAVRFVPDFRAAVVDSDVFTPKTIRRFTWHDNGAVYGAPNKQLDGTTSVKNLFLCGTDQGFVGIIGSIVSGIAMANRHVLQS